MTSLGSIEDYNQYPAKYCWLPPWARVGCLKGEPPSDSEESPQLTLFEIEMEKREAERKAQAARPMFQKRVYWCFSLRRWQVLLILGFIVALSVTITSSMVYYTREIVSMKKELAEVNEALVSRKKELEQVTKSKKETEEQKREMESDSKKMETQLAEKTKLFEALKEKYDQTDEALKVKEEKLSDVTEMLRKLVERISDEERDVLETHFGSDFSPKALSVLHYAAARMLSTICEFDAAERHLLKSIELEPENAFFHSYLGNLYTAHSMHHDIHYDSKVALLQLAMASMHKAMCLDQNKNYIYDTLRILFWQLSRVDYGNRDHWQKLEELAFRPLEENLPMNIWLSVEKKEKFKSALNTTIKSE